MRISFTGLFLIFQLCSVYGQDTIVKKDHSKLAVRLIEVNTETLTYKRFDYPDGPLFILEKKEVEAIIYQNGLREELKQPEPEWQTVKYPDTLIMSPLYALREKRMREGTGLMLSFNGALIINGSYSNKPYRDSPESPGHGSSASYYSRPGKEYYTAGFSLGASLLSGKNEYVKRILALQYTQSHAEFNYNYSYIDQAKSNMYATYSGKTELTYKNTSHFVSLMGGFRFKIVKGLHLETCVALHVNAYSKNRINGLITQKNGPDPTAYHTVKDSVSGFTQVHAALALIPKAAYEFQAGQQKLGVYVSYNLALMHRLPWWTFGVSWYPFKKLR